MKLDNIAFLEVLHLSKMFLSSFRCFWKCTIPFRCVAFSTLYIYVNYLSCYWNKTRQNLIKIKYNNNINNGFQRVNQSHWLFIKSLKKTNSARLFDFTKISSIWLPKIRQLEVWFLTQFILIFWSRLKCRLKTNSKIFSR